MTCSPCPLHRTIALESTFSMNLPDRMTTLGIPKGRFYEVTLLFACRVSFLWRKSITLIHSGGTFL